VDTIRELAEAGVFGVTVPEENGGLSLGLLRRHCPVHAKLEQLVGGETVLAAVAWRERGPNGGPTEASCRYAD
tara:strand:- start:27837 stop:28055 length:219 start_codon:yes stop_codon:yes gene_type:complete